MSLFVRTYGLPRWLELGRIVAGFLVGAAVIALIIWFMGADLRAVLPLVGRSLTSSSLQTDAVMQAIPILLIALGSCLCFRAGFWNIGGEAYFYSGAVAAIAVGLNLAFLPAPLLVLAMAVAATLVGAALSALAGVLRAYRRINEVVVTLMMNLAMVQVVAYMVRGPLADPASRLAFSASLPEQARLGSAYLFLPRIHVGVYVALAAAIASWYVVTRTVFGQSLRVVGTNTQAAVGAGIDARRSIVIASLVLGLLGGLGGMLHVAGATQQVYVGLSPSPGFGYIAIMTALVGRLHPVAVIFSTLLYTMLAAVSDSLQVGLSIQRGFVTVFFGVVLLLIMASEVVLRRARGIP